LRLPRYPIRKELSSGAIPDQRIAEKRLVGKDIMGIGFGVTFKALSIFTSSGDPENCRRLPFISMPHYLAFRVFSLQVPMRAR
jgi:hypothetical protein